ncbi:MAG: succinate dehydrogenase cytochrome b subunit [Gemmatimonadaceae bacterium]|jgi:succinate dehydrogenase / fumarate reductase cytochrome b subunit|nr:succinate dehydrogenase cytochrome b subunit [Gemmatimonadaceae bacterium]MCC6429564.1 succinate dehydrogenase cytochrome b subunit [Gemmatimonadaceae bacterium]
MYALARFWQSTIGKKIVMAVTGMIGILFVLGHMSGNLLMFKGQDAMHQYALLLRTSMPLLWAVRLALIAAVVLHALSAYQLTMRSRAARPVDYASRRPQVTTFAAKTIRWGGVLLLVFIVVHLLQLTTGTIHPQFTHLDPYNNVRVALGNPLIATFYAVAMLALGLHLYHGTWAAFRTLGATPSTAHPLKRRLALLVAIIVALGFMIIPLATLAGAFQEMPPVQEPEANAVAPSVSPSPVAAASVGGTR